MRPFPFITLRNDLCHVFGTEYVHVYVCDTKEYFCQSSFYLIVEQRLLFLIDGTDFLSIIHEVSQKLVWFPVFLKTTVDS